MNPMMPPSMAGGMPMGPAMPGATPNPQSMMMLLQMLQDPMGSAMTLPPQGPLTPEQQVMLAIMGQGRTPTESQVPNMMAMLQSLGQPAGGMMAPPGGPMPMY